VKTIIEPFRIKSVEPLRQTSPGERDRFLQQAGYNLFLIDARNILIDLLTDSGTNAMSTEQWAAMMRGDESYAGSESFFRMERVVRDLTGLKHVIPTHQGRAAERILFTVLCRKGHVVPNNTHFDTTRANIEFTGARAVDLPIAEAADTQARLDFKGNMDVAALERLIESEGAQNIRDGEARREIELHPVHKNGRVEHPDADAKHTDAKIVKRQLPERRFRQTHPHHRLHEHTHATHAGHGRGHRLHVIRAVLSVGAVGKRHRAPENSSEHLPADVEADGKIHECRGDSAERAEDQYGHGGKHDMISGRTDARQKPPGSGRRG